jgi:hypothetical protein
LLPFLWPSWREILDSKAVPSIPDRGGQRRCFAGKLARLMSDAIPESGSTVAAGKARRWVWHSDLESRAAGKVSVLACVETAFAIALYWWIAIRYDTHWHLLTSVFIAPLLLLRSPESIAAGVRWFMKDWFDVGRAESWATAKKVGWFAFFVIVSALLARPVALQLSHQFLPGLEARALMRAAAAIGFISTLAGCVVGFAIWGAVSPSIGRSFSVVNKITLWDRIVPTYSGAVSFLICMQVVRNVASEMVGAGSDQGRIAVASAVASVTVGAGVCMGSIVAAFLSSTVPVARVLGGLGIGVGLSLRAGLVRMAATTRHAAVGGKRIAENWKENNFQIDATVPAELMPEIGTFDGSLALEGFSKAMRAETDTGAKWTLFPALGAFLFLPAFLYRLNIKATCWFYWPLAFLLQPAPRGDADSQQRQALCWPWTNPFQRLWIGVSVALMFVSLTLHHVNWSHWRALEGVAALPLALKVSLALDWVHLKPWHWAQWIVAGAGLGMLALAGNAQSHAANANWAEFRQRWPLHIRLMTLLRRVRTLATIALLLMAFGALALQWRGWQRHVPLPARWVAALEQFYDWKSPEGRQ